MNEGYYPYQVQTSQQLETLIKRITELEKQVENITIKINDSQQQPEVHYHYTFEQMKIEKLEGTLSIGMPGKSDGQPFEDLSVENQRIEGPEKIQTQHKPVHPVEQELITYTQQVLNKRQAKESALQIPEDMKRLIINDIQSQLEERYSYYLQQAEKNHLAPDQAKESAFISCQKDIDKAIELFFMNYKNKGAE